MDQKRSSVHGTCNRQFLPVKHIFEENLNTEEELGAALCVYLKGHKVIDLWGGYIDRERQKPWKSDTLVCMMSITKGMSALCAMVLYDSGLLELDAPVAKYWPEFGQAGKEGITVKQLISHYAGLIYPDEAPEGSIYDWDLMTRSLAKQKPEWPPGTKGAYHSSTYGFLVGELIRRVSGQMPGDFFHDAVAKPLDADYYFGAPEHLHHRISILYSNSENVTMQSILDPTNPIGRAWRILPRNKDFFNSPSFRSATIPSGNGHGNARAVAKVFAVLAQNGTLGEVKLLSPATVSLIREQQWEEEHCGLTGRHFRMGMGLFLNTPVFVPMGPNPNAYGHFGAGGAMAFIDPDAKMSFSFAPNQMCAGASVGKARENLVNSIYKCL